MQDYIATFFSHFGAVRFHNNCQKQGWQSRMAPVPRSLSSSCGTCVFFTAQDRLAPQSICTPELEQLVLADAEHTLLYKAAE